jgi:dTDP-4-dehydrorhamnose reductase
MEILILGHTGLLGNMVNKYFTHCDIKVNTLPSDIRWNSLEFKNFIIENNFDFIVNCIGSIPQRTKDFLINNELPIWLDENSNSKIIHPGTDCEMDNDDYGISKKIARDYIINSSKNTKIIKTSIIGTELNSNYSLMSWFLSNKDGDTVRGFTKQMWNGNTTLTWSKFCLDLINKQLKDFNNRNNKSQD